MTQLVKVEELNKIVEGLNSFEQRKSEIQNLVLSAQGLDVLSPEDKAGLRVVSEKRKELKAERVRIEREGKAMRDLITPVSKLISSKEKDLVSLIEPEEDRLYAREKWVEAELERIKQEKEAQERARIQERIDKLAKYNVAIDYTTVLGMTDFQFEEKLLVAKQEFEAEQERIELERIAAEEAKRAEEERIRKEREELERLRAEREAEEKRIRDEKEKLDAERREIEAEKQRIEEEKQAAIEAKERAEREAKEAEERKQREAEAARQREVELEAAKKEAAEKALREQKEKEERERIAAERKAARQPDKAKLLFYANEVAHISVPSMKSEEGKAILDRFQEALNMAIGQLEKSANSL